MLAQLDDYAWAEAFGYAGEPETNGSPNIQPAFIAPPGTYDLTPFTREDVEEICGIQDGENDELSWLIYGRLKDGRWFSLEAGCDYTGWDCQASGSTVIANSREELERYGMTDDFREALNIRLSDDTHV